jgi:hypothetical protein
MPEKIGLGSQIINFNFVHTFVAENMNKNLYQMLSPGVISATITAPFSSTAVILSNFSALIRPQDKDFIVKTDFMGEVKLAVRDIVWVPPSGPVPGPVVDIRTAYLVARMTWQETEYDYDTDNIVEVLLIDPLNYDSTYDVLIATVSVNSLYEVIGYTLYDQTRVYLHSNCINYDTVQWSGTSGWEGPSGYSGYSGPRTLAGSDSSFMGLSGWSGEGGVYDADDPLIQRWPGNASGNIPISNDVMNVNLNAQYLNSFTAGNEDRMIGVKNGLLCENMVAARLFRSGVEYALGVSGVSGYSASSGYDSISGFSAYVSGYIPISNGVLQTELNTEFLGGYSLSQYSASGHTHSYDTILDGDTYKKISTVDIEGLIHTDAIDEDALEHRHQSLNTDLAFRYDYESATYTAKKMFALAGYTGLGGDQTITFRKTFTSPPRVFLLNNETDEWKAVKEADISTTGFTITHTENTKTDSGTDELVTDTTDNPDFSSAWLAVGELA